MTRGTPQHSGLDLVSTLSQVVARRSGRLARYLQSTLPGQRDPAPDAGQRRRSGQDLDERHTRAVLDLTVRLAEVMLFSGSGTADAVATAKDVAQAYRLTDCVVDVFSTTVFVSALPTADSPPVTIVRTVRMRSTDYTRLADLDRLVKRITSGGVTVDEAHHAMDELTERPHVYPRWLATVGWAGFGLGIAMLLGGTWLTCLLAAVSAAVIDRIGRILNRIGTPFFFQNVAGAAIVTLVAVAAYWFAGLNPTALVATGIVMLLTGLTFVGAMQDAVTGYTMTAMARLGEALFLTAGIVVGIVAGLEVAALAGINIDLHVDATVSVIIPRQPLPIALAVVGAGLAGLCLTIASYSPLRPAVIGGIAAAAAELVLIALGRAGVGQVVATGIAAVLVGFLATLISIRRQAPALITATAAIMPMLPGLAVFRAVFFLAVDQNFADGLGQLLSATAIALALGSGVVLGEFLGSPLRFRAGRVGEFVRADGPPGLRRAVGRVVRLRPARPASVTNEPASESVALEPVVDEMVDSIADDATGRGAPDT